MRTVTVLGSTGSVGKNALTVAREHPKEFRVVALAAGSNHEELYRQIQEFSPKMVYLEDSAAASKIKEIVQTKLPVYSGPTGLRELVQHAQADVCVVASTGTAALEATLEAIRLGKTIALANKEILVAAGGLIMQTLRSYPDARVVPVDSEHSAIFQCLEGAFHPSLTSPRFVKRLLLTGTGGPLRHVPVERFRSLSIDEVINHPKWKMGKKISVDSATLMNKGLEIIEASALFGIHPEKIDVLIHPEAVVHSMVEFVDGAVLAQLGVTDMRLPIRYAMAYPERLEAPATMYLDWTKASELHFEPPDSKKFPCLGLAQHAAKQSGTAPCVLSAADEVAVNHFLDGKIPFVRIADVIENVLSSHRHVQNPDLAGIRHAQSWATQEAQKLCQV